MKPTINFLHVSICGVLVLLFIGGCIPTRQSQQSIIEMPPNFSAPGVAPLPPKWWYSFEDRQLNTLIEEALLENFSLQAAWDRLHQARATYKKNNASLFPSLEAEGSASHKTTRTNGVTTSSNTLSLGLSTSYEIDLWGRINSTVEAAHLDMEGTEADLNTAAMTLSAEIANTWYRLIELHAQLNLIEKQTILNEQALEIVSAQFRTGQAPMADILQQRQLLESSNAEKAQLTSELHQNQNLLTVLLGDPPGTRTFEIPSNLPDISPLPVLGIPAETILNRPDIKSAHIDVLAADKRIAAATANLFPSVRLTASITTSGTSVSDLFSNYIATLAGSLTGPILDGGQRRAEVERTQAVAAEKLHLYGQAIIEAIGEIEDALIIEQQQKTYIESLENQLTLANETIAQVKDRYLKGTESYERILSSLTSQQNLEQNLLSARRTLLTNRIQLCRALGSGWNIVEE